MNNNETKSARHLRTGDVLSSSGFVVTHNAWRGTRSGAGKVYVEGYYPDGTHKRFEWNGNTVVSVQKDS